jgi:hypothetical protein
MSVRRDIPISMRATYDKAMTGKSRTAAVRAFCQECCGYERFQVSLCTDTGCPLYRYRPYRSAAAIRKARDSVDGASDTPKKPR